ncbi:GA4 desaturase [Pleurostoma richardsiae]|uniref:GA4 desaturase n=1 Tax=Pleurostoma richardsiae TaxID=41990 RepID=A0AA38RDW5_9PEZI|nr:GA4 desaturase [Pleurostoma richardsiae]
MAATGSLLAEPVIGKLRFVSKEHTPEASPHNFHLPDISEFGDERLVPLCSMRPLPTVSELPLGTTHAQLHTHGFTAVNHPTTLNRPPYDTASWKDPNLLKEYYIPDTAQMLKQITGCKTVVTEALLLRSALWSPSDALATHAGHGAEPAETPAETVSDLETGFPQFIGFDAVKGGASPAPKVHLDYAPAGARSHLRMYHPDLSAAAADIIRVEDSLLASGRSPKEDYGGSGGPRWALFSVWRPLKTVRRDPLALGDQRTFKSEDYVPVNIKTPCLGLPGVTETFECESFVGRYSEGQEWFWVDEQTPDEVLVIGLFDSDVEKEGGTAAGGTLHSSVELPGTEEEQARESLELRCLCVW